eukprot:TRINITY_DN3687_c0_g1_i10.p1 TRINITY_DN3687_c0_g1~~TRINITY_DN3687_c0_g1_i10.p1  ORF type:complete len:155 (+),score=33.61 TRINITY_DN3687_c0_g1_i10:579-1043(+)
MLTGKGDLRTPLPPIYDKKSIWRTPFLTSPTDAGFALLVRSHLSLVKSFVLREMNSHAKDNQLISKILNYFLLVSKELLELKNMFTLFGVIAGIQDFLSTNLEATSLLSAEDFAWLEMTSDNFVHQQEITPVCCNLFKDHSSPSPLPPSTPDIP